MKKTFLVVLSVVLFTNCTVDDGEIIKYFSVSEINPVHSVPGDTVEVRGSGFLTGSTSIYLRLNNQELKILNLSDSMILVKIPDFIEPSIYDFSIENISRTYIQEYYIKDYRAPRITKIDPSGSSAGDIINIHGKYFPIDKSKIYCFFYNGTNNTSVTLKDDEFIFLSDQLITLKIPSEIPSGVQGSEFSNSIFFILGPLGINNEKFSMHTSFR